MAGGPIDTPDEHPFVASARATPESAPAVNVRVTGLFANSDDPEKQRVYLSSALDYYADFRAEDVVHYEPIAAERSPIPGYDATRVTLKRGSPIAFTYMRTQSLIADDQFDIDVRLGPGGSEPGSQPPGALGSTGGATQRGGCDTGPTGRPCATYECAVPDRTMGHTATCHTVCV
jgi:hypothetical protein